MKSVVDGEGVMPAPVNAPGTFVPTFPRGLLRNLTVDIALPWITVQLLTHELGFSDLSAVALGALFPAASIVANGLRRRRVDFIGLIVLVTLIGGLAIALVTQDVRFAMMRAVPGATIFGLACLLSLGRRAPVMFFVARQFTAGDDPAKLAAWNARLDGSAGFRRAMRILTLVWGLAFLAKAALWTVAALVLPTAAALLTGPMLGIGTFAALMAWTIAFARRRAGGAR